MSPNPVALRISRETYRSYTEVRRALNLLEWHFSDMTPEWRVKLVEKGARLNKNVLDLAKAVSAARVGKPPA